MDYCKHSGQVGILSLLADMPLDILDQSYMTAMPEREICDETRSKNLKEISIENTNRFLS